MKTYSEYLIEKLDDTHFAGLDIENTQKIYNMAMRADNAADLKKSMIKMKKLFPDIDKINFDKVKWDKIFDELNENTKPEAYIVNLMEALK